VDTQEGLFQRTNKTNRGDVPDTGAETIAFTGNFKTQFEISSKGPSAF
jgi:hypothetical protein